MARCAICDKGAHFGNNVSLIEDPIKCGNLTLNLFALK